MTFFVPPFFKGSWVLKDFRIYTQRRPSSGVSPVSGLVVSTKVVGFQTQPKKDVNKQILLNHGLLLMLQKRII
jgi:hypothetical protein